MRFQTEEYLAVMLICVEHDGGVSQDIDNIWILEQLWALLMVTSTKALHDAVDLLRLPWQSERVQVDSDSNVKGHACTANAQESVNALYTGYLFCIVALLCMQAEA